MRFGDATAVAVGFEGDDLGVVDETIDEGGHGGGVGDDGGPPLNGRLVVSARLRRS